MTVLAPADADSGPDRDSGAAAGSADRFLARLVDLVLADVVLSLLLLFAPRPAAFATWAALSLGYYVGLEARTGRTLGKRLLGLRVEGPTGGRVTIQQALRRHVADGWPLGYVVAPVGGWLGPVAVTVAVVGAVLVMVGLERDPSRGGWPDRLSGTCVVHRP